MSTYPLPAASCPSMGWVSLPGMSVRPMPPARRLLSPPALLRLPRLGLLLPRLHLLGHLLPVAAALDSTADGGQDLSASVGAAPGLDPPGGTEPAGPDGQATAWTRWHCLVTGCSCADASQQAGWATLTRVLSHINAHLSGQLSGHVTSDWSFGVVCLARRAGGSIHTTSKSCYDSPSFPPHSRIFGISLV